MQNNRDIDTVQVPLHQENHEAVHKKIFAVFWDRIRTTPMSFIVFQFTALIAYFIFMLPTELAIISTAPVISRLKIYLSYCVIPLIMTLVLKLGTVSGTDTIGRPGRFFLMLLLATISAAIGLTLTNIAMGINIFALGADLNPGSEDISIVYVIIYIFWRCVEIIIIFGFFSGLGFVYLQRMEDNEIFSLLLTRRSMLARQVAQSRLLAARAQIDPEMISRILRNVHERYYKNSDAASNLLDHLINYLRLAMNRMREKNSTYTTELALIRSYLVLREAETGMKVDLQIYNGLGDREQEQYKLVTAPLFLMIREVCKEAVFALCMELRIEIYIDRIVLDINMGSTLISGEDVARLKTEFNALLIGRVSSVHHFFESGVNRYVVQSSIH